MHTILRETCLLPEVPAERLDIGERVAFAVTDWVGGEVTFEGVVTARFSDGSYRIRTTDEAVYKVPAEILLRVTEEDAS